jgi:predicted GNAT family N-acyltransferase
MLRKTQFTIRHVAWAASWDDLHAIRRKVFIEEQQVPEELEWDGEDEASTHVLAVAADGMPIGTARLLRDGHIGRMAVLKEWRRRGVGSALMSHLLGVARASGHAVVRLHAQAHAAGFYAKHGFSVEGGEFIEAGIPHVVMTRTLVMDDE